MLVIKSASDENNILEYTSCDLSNNKPKKLLPLTGININIIGIKHIIVAIKEAIRPLFSFDSSSTNSSSSSN